MSGAFTVFPAIDLRRGRVVRLSQGRDDAQTAYGDDPVAVATSFVEAGATALHVVDLDAAFGDGAQREVIGRIVDAAGVPVQVGGGVRDDAAADALLAVGVSRVIVGSAAVERPEWLGALVSRLGERVVVGIDARDGEVKLRGWVEGGGRSALEVASDVAARGVREVIYTDIARDGMLGGPDIAGSRELAEQAGVRVIVSGGVSGAGDIAAAAVAGDGVVGVIVGRALYEGCVDVAGALRAAREAR